MFVSRGLVAMQNDHNKIVGFADDVTASGNLEGLRRWWDTLMQSDPNYGYYPQPTKSWLIAKENKLEEAVRVFGGTNIQISTEGKRRLGAVIGTEENEKNHINDKNSKWTKEINMLAKSDEKTKRMMETLNQKEVSNWLTNLPIKEHGYELMKQEFWDAIKINYNWLLDRIPCQCICGASFDVTQALSCKKGGFITLRHNEVRDITSELLDEVCVDVRKETVFQEVNNEDLPRVANKSKEARLDISALNFWTSGQQAFFDVRVFTLFAQRHSRMAVEKSFRANENEKKRSYGNRVLQIENASFTRLVFAANGGMGKECIRFYKRLGEMIADKRKAPISIVTNNIRILICFSLLRRTIRCLRGSRSPRY